MAAAIPLLIRIEMEKQIQQYSPSERSIALSDLIQHDFNYTLTPFDEHTLSFLNTLSVKLLNNKAFNRNPEIVSLGFWLRKANISRFKEENQHILQNARFSVNPLGLVFHVAPSNVDTIFLYSLCISLLMGNRNIIRLSSRSTATVDFIINNINQTIAMTEYGLFSEYIRIVTYGHEEGINKYFSEHANCRVIWGGDKTVHYFKSIPSNVYSKDIVFPNRISYAVFKASAYFQLSMEQQQELVGKFFNDAYVFDQMGCSSPKLIYVLGDVEEKDSFIELFYNQVTEITQLKYREQAGALSTLKLNTLVNDVIVKEVQEVKHANNSAYFVELPLKQTFGDSCGGGYFYVKHIQSIADILHDSFQAVQTLSYFGINQDELSQLDKLLLGRRIDRIVPVGLALSFHYIWDGMNLFEEFSRKRRLE